MSGDRFGCCNLGQGEAAPGLQWVEARDTAKQPMRHRVVPQTKNYPVPNMNNTEVEKLCFLAVKV